MCAVVLSMAVRRIARLPISSVLWRPIPTVVPAVARLRAPVAALVPTNRYRPRTRRPTRAESRVSLGNLLRRKVALRRSSYRKL